VDITDKIRQVVEAEGYEIAHGQEAYGDSFFGLVILVKMSERKLVEKDRQALYRAADSIKRALHTVSAELDPDGPNTRAAYRAEIEDIYRAAGVLNMIRIEERPNDYCSDPCCLNKPWFRVTSHIGDVIIGWRKSVLSIDWHSSDVKKTGEELFPFEDVTRYHSSIHAHGVIKAVEYIRKLHTPEALS
jgi:hypothetical protein